MSIEINNESGVAVDEVALSDLGRYMLDAMRVNPLADLSVVLLDSAAMSALHEQWMDVPGPTDVMAFPMDGSEPPDVGGAVDHPGRSRDDEHTHETMLGDVVLCPEVAAEQAGHAGHSAEAELHLLGYDHGNADEERAMFELQARVLRDWSQASGRGPIHAPLPGTDGEVRDTR